MMMAEGGYEYQYVASRSGTDTNAHTLFIELSIDTGNQPLIPWIPR
jgi:hypothetical protein